MDCENLRNISDVFNTQFAAFDGNLENYFNAKNSALNVAGRVFFHLVENKDENYPFAFLATYSEGKKDGIKHIPLKNALETTSKKDLQATLLNLLSAVSRAADKSEFISELVESGELFSPLRFKPDEAYTFLRETPIYEESGVVCRIPNFWKSKQSARLKASVESKEPAVLGLDALMAFSPSIHLGGEEFTREEIEQLLKESRGLAFLKGKWVEVDPDKLAQKKKKAEKQLEKLRKKDPNIEPVIIEGRKISDTWWGNAWCKNLESYADFSNRIGRGRSYVKNGFVVDLKIEEGEVNAKVMGSSLYTAKIKIALLDKPQKEKIVQAVGRRIDSVASLVEGKFPKEFEDFC